MISQLAHLTHMIVQLAHLTHMIVLLAHLTHMIVQLAHLTHMIVQLAHLTHKIVPKAHFVYSDALELIYFQICESESESEGIAFIDSSFNFQSLFSFQMHRRRAFVDYWWIFLIIALILLLWILIFCCWLYVLRNRGDKYDGKSFTFCLLRFQKD